MMRPNNKFCQTDGVSESIGFLLIFTLVIVGIGLVTLYGYPMLIQQQVSADEQIMQKNMIVLQNDVKSLSYKTVPYKETSLKVGGGGLTSYNPLCDTTAPKFAIFDQNTNNYVTEYRSGDLRFESDSAQTDISLQNGAVVTRKKVEPGSVMLAEPRWFYDEITNTIVINLIALNNTETVSGKISRSGVSTVQMTMNPESLITIHSVIPANHKIFVKYTWDDPTQDYHVAWENYFKNTMKMNEESSCSSATSVCYSFIQTPTRETNLVIKKYEAIIQSL